MTLLEVWEAIQQYGTGFVLFLGVVLFFTGRLVNGEVARQARLDAEALWQKRYDEMQATWRERCEELGEERNYYRNIALAFARQAEQGIALAAEKLPRL